MPQRQGHEAQAPEPASAADGVDDVVEHMVGADAESALREADLRDASDAVARKQLRILVLAVVAILLMGWAGLEASSPLVAMLAGFAAVFPLKAAVRRYLALETRKRELLEE